MYYIIFDICSRNNYIKEICKERKKICCFAGHNKEYSNLIISSIQKKAEELIIEDKVTEFWVGNYGKFDFVSADIIRDLKRTYPNIKLILQIL